MERGKSVLTIGLDPTLLDFSSPELAHTQLTAEKVLAGLKGDSDRLRDLGYQPDICLVDLGQTAEAVVAKQVASKRYDCVVIGAGIRSNPKFFLLFEKLINVVHTNAPQAKIAFNSKPTDTAEAVERWI